MQRFTKEWFNSVVEKLKTDGEFQEKGKGFDSSMHLRVLKDRKGKLSKDVAFGMWLPTCDPYWFGEKPIDEVDIVVEGKAGVLVDVFTGKKNVVVALSTGGLKLKKGSVNKLTGSLGALNRFLDVIGLV